MMVIYLPVKFEFDWTNRFRVTVQKQKCGRTDGWTNRQKSGQTNGRNYTNFKRNLAMVVIYLHLIGQTVFELESRNEKFRRRDGRRTHQSNWLLGNPPKN